MTVSNFKPSLALTLAYEGGYVNHPRDPGGATNRGVIQRVYDAYRKRKGRPVQSVRNITDDEVAEIYKKQYWDNIKGDSLPTGVDYAVFDFGVNSGPARAARYLQRVVGVPQDGIIGVVTLTAVEAMARTQLEKLIAQYCADRLAFVSNLSTFDVFGKGWTRRIVGAKSGYQANDTGVIDYAIAMAKREAAMLTKLPNSIGSVEGEEAGKAEAPLTTETFVTGGDVDTVADLKAKLPTFNDNLAKIIGR